MSARYIMDQIIIHLWVMIQFIDADQLWQCFKMIQTRQEEME
jgi:hypothetical protein